MILILSDLSELKKSKSLKNYMIYFALTALIITGAGVFYGKFN